MNTFTKKCLLTFVVIGSAITATDQVSACGSRGGYRRVTPSYHSYHSYRHVYRAPQVIRRTPQPIVTERFAPQPVQPVRFSPQPIQQPGQQFAQQPVQQIQQQPVQQVAPQPVQQVGGVQQTPPVVNQVRRTVRPVGQINQQQRTPQQSALQMLSAFGAEPQQNSTPVEEPQVEQRQFSEVGTWKATLTNGSVVQLELDASRRFVWKAVSNGKLSTFSGNFNIDNGTLTLARSTDSKKLVGSMTPNGLEGFTFQLQGTNDNGLQFVRG